MTEKMTTQQPTMDEFLDAMKGKAEDLLTKFFKNKRFDGEPWAEELFEVTMQVVVDVTVANTDITDFNVNTSIENHILLMTVEDNQGNTIADVLYFITKDDNGYVIDDLQVAFKLGAFVAPQEEHDKTDQLPF